MFCHRQAITWQAVTKPITVKLQAGEKIYFKFNDTLLHDVILLKDKAAYDKCDTKAELAELIEDGGPGTYPIGPLKAGTYYYACGIKGHCAAGQKATVIAA